MGGRRAQPPCPASLTRPPHSTGSNATIDSWSSDYHLAPSFAAGRVLSPGMFVQMTAQTYYNPYLPELMHCMLATRDDEDGELDALRLSKGLCAHAPPPSLLPPRV